MNLLLVRDHKLRTNWNHVTGWNVSSRQRLNLALAIGKQHCWFSVRTFALSDHLGRESRHGVDLLLHGDTLFDVLELNHAGNVSDDRIRIGIPLSEHIALFDLTALF